jgi:hypothetical protein
MTLLVEDGTVVAGAESYTSVAAATAYHLARGNSTWASLTTGQMEEALRRATDYMEQAYRDRWSGLRMTSTQALSWPRAFSPIKDRTGYYASDAVPTIVANACAELALRAAAADLFPDLTRGVLKEKVGPIEVEYDPASPAWSILRQIDSMLRPFFNSGGGLFHGVVRT